MNRKTIKHRREVDYDCNHKPNQICEEFSCVVRLQDQESKESKEYKQKQTPKLIYHEQHQNLCEINYYNDSEGQQQCQRNSYYLQGSLDQYFNLYDNQQHEQESFYINNMIQYNKMNESDNSKSKFTKQKQNKKMKKIINNAEQGGEKPTSNEKYDKIKKRLDQRDTNYIKPSVFIEHIFEQLGKEFNFEYYQNEYQEIELTLKQTKLEEIFQTLQSNFNEYQTKISGLEEIEEYIILLLVKLRIYNFFLRTLLLDQIQLQHVYEDLEDFFNKLKSRDEIMKQAKDYIIFKKQFQLSNQIQEELKKNIKDYLHIDKFYYKSISTRYFKYIKEKKNDFKIEKFVGKNQLQQLIQKDTGELKQFTANDYYQRLIQNKNKMIYLTIYVDDTFNMLIKYDHLRQQK